VYCDKPLQIGSRNFHCKAAKSSSFSMVRLKTKFLWSFLGRGLDLCWSGLRFCKTVATAGYILRLTYDVTPPRTARTNRRCTSRRHKHGVTVQHALSNAVADSNRLDNYYLKIPGHRWYTDSLNNAQRCTGNSKIIKSWQLNSFVSNIEIKTHKWQ